ncbi:MAG: 4'-phosphopantetheinyl transferase family protein [Acholeplasmatales bacterium]
MKIYIRKIEKLNDFHIDEEVERIHKFKSEKRRLESLAGYFLLKDILKEKGYNSFKIIRNKNKKPQLDIPLDYSISHSNEYVVCVVSKEKVGIDIERKTDKFFKIKRKIGEVSDDLETLTINWTLKEAYLKYLGDVRIPLKEIKIINKNPYILEYKDKAYAEVIKYENYIISVCMKEPKKVVLVYD